MSMVRLGDICELRYGKALPATSRVHGEVPVFSSAGITGWHNSPLVDSRGIIIGRKGTVGKVYRSNVPFYCIDTAYYILPNDSIYDFDFLYYVLQTLGLESLNEDSAVPGLNRDTAYSQLVYMPSLKTQQQISSILLTLDKKIDNTKQINDNLLQQAQALFKDRFLSLDEIPFGWKRMTLGDISDMSAGGDKPKIISNQRTKECQYPVYSNGISDEGLYGFTTEYKISVERVTVSARGTIGFVCLRHTPFTPIVRLVTLVPRSNIVSA